MEKESSSKKILHIEVDLQKSSVEELKKVLKEIVGFESTVRAAIYFKQACKR